MAQVKKKVESPARAERRRSPRHRLCLDAEVEGSGELAAPVVVHELSQTGFLIEATVPLSVGQPLQLRLPQEQPVAARVVWSCGRHFGCELQRPLTSAAVSAALLKARPSLKNEGLPRRLRLESADEDREKQPSAGEARGGQLRLALGLSVFLWSALAAAVLYIN